MRNRIGRPRFGQGPASGHGISPFAFPDAPMTGGPWGRQAGAWVDVTEEAPIDGIIYGRQNGAWVAAAGGGGGLDIATGDARYVNQNGDTMTGDLTISKSIPRLILNRAAVGDNAVIFGKLNDVFRWGVFVGNGVASEPGGNVGSDFLIQAYDDLGNALGSALQLTRSDKQVNTFGSVTVNRAASNYFYKMQSSGSFTGMWGISVLSGGQFCLDDGFGQWLRIHPTGTSTPGLVNVPCTIPSTSPSSGAFVVEGGVGVGGNINVGGLIDINGNLYVGKVQTGVNSEITIRSAFDQQGWLNFYQGVQQRMSILCQASSGDLLFARWNDAGAFVDTPVSISRATGLLTATGSLGVQIYNSLGPDTRGLLRLMQPAGTPGAVGSIQGMYGSNFLGSIDFTSEGMATNSGFVSIYTGFAGATLERIRVTANGDVGVGTPFPITFTVANRKFLTLQTEGLVSPVISLGINDGAPAASRAFGQLVFHNSARAGTDKRVAVIAAIAQNAVVDTSTLVFQVWKAGVAFGLLEVRGHEEVVKVLASTPSTSPTTGAFQVDGGVGVGGALNVGGVITGPRLRLDGAGYARIEHYYSGVIQWSVGLMAPGDNNYAIAPEGSGASVKLTSGTVSSSYSTGALVVAGGAGIGGALNVGQEIRSFTGIGLDHTDAYIQFRIGGVAKSNISINASQMFFDYHGNVVFRDTINGHANRMSVSPTSFFVNFGTISSNTSTGALVVTGGVGVSGQLNVAGPIVQLGPSASIIANATSSDPSFQLYTGAGKRWTLLNGIGVGDAFVVMDKEGDHGVQIAQNGTGWITWSDRRLWWKKNKKPITILDKIAAFDVWEFERNGAHEYGGIAQDVYEVFPALVQKGEDDDDRELGKLDPGTWTMMYERAGMLALAGIKELLERIEALETRH